MTITKSAVLDAVASLMRRRFNADAERDKPFVWGDTTITADLYLPNPLHCIVQFDDAAHCTRERAKTFANYPSDTPLNFDVRRYQADQTAGDATVAQSDVLADLLAPKHGFNPTVRIRFDEIDELSGPLADRIESLLSKRFAFHAGTTFHLMVDNAGAKPHSQTMHRNLSD
ncbi:MAG: hypothetical protein ABSA12_10755 [Verrucomicrobiia bacterium]